MKARVLLIEDTKSFIENLKFVLQDDFDVTSVTNLEDSYQKIKEELFHIVIADLDLGRGFPKRGEDGLTVLAEMRQRKLPTIQVVVSELHEVRKMLDEIKHYTLVKDLNEELAKGLEIDGRVWFSKAEITSDMRSFAKKLKEKEKLLQTNFDLQINATYLLESYAKVQTQNILSRYDRYASQPEQAFKHQPHQAWLSQLIQQGEIDLQKRVLTELEDLLRQLFPQEKTITLKRVGGGFSRASVLRVQRTEEGRAPVIVKFGYNLDIDEERDNYFEHVSGGLMRCAYLERTAQTPLLSGIRYSLIGAARQAKSFQEVFEQESEFSNDNFYTILKDLFSDNCRYWYGTKVNRYYDFAGGRKEDNIPGYPESLNCDTDKLEIALSQLQKATNGTGNQLRYSKDHYNFSLRLDDIKLDMPNPLYYLIKNGQWQTGIFDDDLPLCRTHGDMNARNIMVDVLSNSDIPIPRTMGETGPLTQDKAFYQTWLIDFYRTYPEHAFRDFIQLETVVRFVLMNGGTLKQRLHFESLLLKQDYMDDTKNPVKKTDTLRWLARKRFPPVFQRAYSLIFDIRHRASRTIYPDFPTEEARKFNQYDYGLIYHCLNTIRYYKPMQDEGEGIDVINALHALAAASMLVKKHLDHIQVSTGIRPKP